MKYTTNYNLYKPDYDDTIDVDFLNKNMDVLDKQVHTVNNRVDDTNTTIENLDYVNNVTTSDTGLTFTKRNGDTIPVSLNYLPISGGNITGDLTIQNKGIPFLLEELKNVINDKITIYARKYADGRLENIIKITGRITGTNITFLVPFVSNDIFTSYGRMIWGGPAQEPPYSIGNIDKTGCTIANAITSSGQDNVFLGRWK